MAITSICARCGQWGLGVRRREGRVCVPCCISREFDQAPGRSLRGYITKIVRRDDARDDAETPSVEDHSRGPSVVVLASVE